MPGCSAKRCGRNSSKKDQFHENGIDKVSFHQFPADKERKADWIRRVREAGKGNLWNPSHNAKLCSLHFEEIYIDRSCIDKSKPMTILRETAVPTIFPHVKPKGQKKIKTAKEVRFEEETKDVVAEETAGPSRRSDRIAAKPKINFEQLVQGLGLNDEDEFHHADYGLQFLYPEEPRLEISSQGEKKMVTIPSDEGFRVILPNIIEQEQLIKNERMIGPQSPQPDMDALIGAPTAKFVSLGAQPFNDDDHDAVPQAEPVLEDLCCGYDGPSCSNVQESCTDFYGKPFSLNDACDSITAEEKIEGSPANKLRQAIELLQSFQVDMFKELPKEQLVSFESLLMSINSEGSDLLRNLAIKQHQLSALKRFSKAVPESEEGKRLCPDELAEFQIPQLDDIDITSLELQDWDPPGDDILQVVLSTYLENL